MEKELAISAPSTASASTLEPRIICRVCQRQFAQYTCPRCNVRYCSLSCYKGHSTRCTESFTRENVMEELRSIQPEEETKKKMIDILKRLHSEEEMDCDDEDDSESELSDGLIQKVLSGGEVSLDDLSPDERKRFQNAVATGQLSKLIEPWTPWWTKPSAREIVLRSNGSQLINFIGDNPEVGPDDIPAGPDSPLAPLGQLTHAKPSPVIAVHLVDIIYAYCFTLRLFNGDWRSDPFGAATAALSMSGVLSGTGGPDSVREALLSCLENTCSPAYRHTGGRQFAIALVGDVVTLISLGSNAIVCALCDLRRLFVAAGGTLKMEKISKAERSECRRKLHGAERKTLFLTSWAHEQPDTAWLLLVSSVEALQSSLAEGDDSVLLSRPAAKMNLAPKKFVEEV